MYKHMKNIVFALLMLLSSFSFSQEGELILYGRVENQGKVLGYVDLEIVKDNDTIIQVSTQKNGDYKVNFELGSVYNIAFSKPGYIKKTVDVIGVSPQKDKVSGKYTFQLDIELLKENENRVDETMLPPVAKLYITDPNEGFTFDKRYVKWGFDEYYNAKD